MERAPVKRKILTAADINFHSDRRPAKRRLFMDADDSSEEPSKLIARLNLEIEEEYSKKWDFDFASDKPLPSTRFSYTRMRPDEVPGFKKLENLVKNSVEDQKVELERSSRSNAENVPEVHAAQNSEFILPVMKK